MFSSAAGFRAFELDQTERQLALQYLAEAWNEAEDDGVQSAALAHASLLRHSLPSSSCMVTRPRPS